MVLTDLQPAVVSLPWGAWRDDLQRPFEMAPDWRVCLLGMKGAPEITAEKLAGALDAPLGATPLERLVTPATSVAIAIDDITRPTPLAAVAGGVAERLGAAGVPDDQITIVVATGAHRRATASDVDQKIGARLAGRFRLVCHDPLDTLVHTGVKLAGVPVRVNRAFHEADVRIGIGAVLPHPFAGFSGGGKIVIPGLADLEVLVRTHKYALMGLAGGHRLVNNRFRADMEAAVRTIGLHWTVNVVVNAERKVAFVAAGDLVSAHRAAAAAANEYGRTARPAGPLDALLLNAYPKDGELLQIEAALVALKSGMLDWLTPTAPIVLMAACGEGLGNHGLFGPHGRLFRTPAAKSFLQGRPLIVFSPDVELPDARKVFWTGYPFYRTWPEVIADLRARLPARPRVGVVPCGPLQTADEAGA